MSRVWASSIGSNAFNGCTNLRNITLPSDLTSIDSNAFGGCTSLTTITIPPGATTISQGMFSGYPSLETVTFENNSSIVLTSHYGSFTKSGILEQLQLNARKQEELPSSICYNNIREH
jgi:hypothetical protein